MTRESSDNGEDRGKSLENDHIFEPYLYLAVNVSSAREFMGDYVRKTPNG